MLLNRDFVFAQSVVAMLVIRWLQFQLCPNWGQFKFFGCPVFDVAPVLFGRRAV